MRPFEDPGAIELLNDRAIPIRLHICQLKSFVTTELIMNPHLLTLPLALIQYLS